MKTTLLSKVTRKRDGEPATVVRIQTAVQRMNGRGGFAHKTIYTVRLDDSQKRQESGGDMAGDASWLKSTFRGRVE